MTNQSGVYIEREGRRFKWGEARYFRTWNGMKETVSVRFLRAVSVPFALGLGAWAIFVSGRKDAASLDDHEFPAPSTLEMKSAQGLNVPILQEQDLVNRIPKPKVSLGAGGRIRVYNLRASDSLPVASEARAVLISGATNGIVKARLTEAMRVDGESLLPEGTIVFGRGKSGDERLSVEFQKAIFPQGESIKIRAQAFDLKDRILGLRGSVVGSRTKKMALAMGFGVLGGAMDGLKAPATTAWGTSQQPKSVRDAALTGAAKAALDQSQSYMDELKSSPNIIEVKAGTEFILMIDEPKPKEEN